MTDSLVRNIRTIQKDKIDQNTYMYANKCFLDYLAVTISGARIFSNKIMTYIRSIQVGDGEVSVIGLNYKVDMQTAALINGMNAHVIELDDGHRQGALHVGSTVFSALLAVAEKEKLSSEDFLYGAIIGYEVAIRLACAVQPGNKLRGYHATGTCGTIGATMGIAAALGFDEDQMKSALSAAITCAAGVLEMQEDNSEYKPLNVGRAAMDAVAAAYLGKACFTPPFDAIGGKRGFLNVMTDTPKPQYITDFAPDEPLAITRIYMKTYAACRHTHPAIEAALTLRKKYDISSQDIESVEVETYKLAVSGHDHTDILGINSAKMSLPFSVALALCKGEAGMEVYCEKNIKDETILALTKKVSVVENDELTSWVPKKRASILHLNLYGGTRLTHQVDYPKGEPENPLTDEEVEYKFMSLASVSGFALERCNDILKILRQPKYELRDLMGKLNRYDTLNNPN